MLSTYKKINLKLIFFLLLSSFHHNLSAQVDLSGMWVSNVRVSDRDSFWPKDLPYTNQGLIAHSKAGTPEDPAFQCIIGFGRIISAGFPTEIIQTEKQVTILYEYNHQVRRIYTDGRNHPEKIRHSLMGHSIGHWDDSTLVVDTVGLKPLFFRLHGVPYSKGAHFIEKIKLLDNNKTLENIISIDDPKFYTKPWEAKIYLSLDNTAKIMEYDCTIREHLKP
jgi:hypothetical protein